MLAHGTQEEGLNNNAFFWLIMVLLSLWGMSLNCKVIDMSRDVKLISSEVHAIRIIVDSTSHTTEEEK